jgi:hypothetical protein
MKKLNPNNTKQKVDMYKEEWKATLDSTKSTNYEPTLLFAFANGYNAAIKNIKLYGIERVEKNATTGCAS